MFIDGIAGIENTASTAASVTGLPFSITMTSTLLLPDTGGFGVENCTDTPCALGAAAAVCRPGGSGAASRAHDASPEVSSSAAPVAAALRNHMLFTSCLLQRPSPIASRHVIRSRT